VSISCLFRIKANTHWGWRPLCKIVNFYRKPRPVNQPFADAVCNIQLSQTFGIGLKYATCKEDESMFSAPQAEKGCLLQCMLILSFASSY